LSAAHLLYGATECPRVDKFLAKNGPLPMGDDGWPTDWPEWTAWFMANTVKCESCGAFNFTDEFVPDICGNCLAALPKAKDEDEE